MVTGRMTDVSGGRAQVELGEGIQATCRMAAEAPKEEGEARPGKADLSSLTSMLPAKWKGGQGGGGSKGEAARTGQIRSFRIVKLDPAHEEDRSRTRVEGQVADLLRSTQSGLGRFAGRRQRVGQIRRETGDRGTP